MKIFLLIAGLGFAFCEYSSAQILCIQCYDQNDSISTGVTNLLLNGGFENTTCEPSTGVIGEHSSFCPNSNGYACDFADWTCTGGGSNTYACLYNDSVNKSIIIEGNNAVYFGNYFANPCSPVQDDMSCLTDVGCTVQGPPAGYPNNPDPAYGGSNGVSLEQTVNGLTPGNTYVLEFWAGGEEYYFTPGMFAVNVGFGDTLLKCKSTGPGETGTEYIIQFVATSASHTIKFTNWGHICSSCTELVLDNVRLYTISQLSSTVPVCTEPPAISSFAVSDTDLCEKFCVNFYDSSANNPTSWAWSFPGGSPSFSSDQNPTNICYDTPGIYDVTLITSNAGGNDTLTLQNYITVYSTPPAPIITQNGYTLTSSAADFYQWQLNTTDIPGATNQSYNILQTGFYTVVVSDSNGCKNSATKYMEITGIDEVSDAKFSILPNPSSGNFVIAISDWQNKNLSLDIFNSLGQKIYSYNEKISSHLWQKEINLSRQPAGIYFIEVNGTDRFFRKKIVITQ